MLGLAAPAGAEVSPPASLALLRIEVNRGAEELAAGVGSALASRLSLGPQLRLFSELEAQPGCAQLQCLAALSERLGCRYVVSVRLDRFGRKYLLSTALFDAQSPAELTRHSAQAEDEEGLPEAAEKVAGQLLDALGIRPAPQGFAPRPTLGLKLGNQFLAELIGINPAGKLELGFRFEPEWLAFLQVGFSMVRADDAGTVRRLTLVPTALGVRKLHRIEQRFQPYWGAGLGLQLSTGQFGFVAETESFPTVLAMFGFQYMFTQSLGGLVEASTNLAQAVLGLRHGTGLGDGLNFDLSLGLLYRF